MAARILVIEDNADNMKLMVYLLKASAHEVSSAMSGEEGLARIEEMPFDVIICDIQLPGIGGEDVARTLKADTQWSDIPLIAVTAYAMVGDRDKIMSAGFDDYIAKPIEPRTFVKKIETHLETKLQSDPYPVAPSPTKRPQRKRDRGTILVLDNTPANIHLVRSQLETCGFNVIGATCATDALKYLELARPDLILSDVHMPDTDGFEFFVEYKKDENSKDTPLVFISSTTLYDTDAMRARELGAKAFLKRPITTRKLLETIESLIPHCRPDEAQTQPIVIPGI